MLVYNPELHKQIYGHTSVDEQGQVVREPTTEEEFEAMLREWEGADYVPLA